MRKKKGFTLAELLIVVAIIAVLVAISIPIFTSQLEKSRESTDLANVRAAYAEVMAEANSDSGDSSSKTYSRKVELKQKKDDWQRDTADLIVGGIKSNNTLHWKGKPKAGGTCTVSYSEVSGVVINWDGTVPHIFTSAKSFLDSKLSSIGTGDYTGYLIKDGSTLSYKDSLDGHLSPGCPANAVVFIYSSNGKEFLFQDLATNETTTWEKGDPWDETKLQ